MQHTLIAAVVVATLAAPAQAQTVREQVRTAVRGSVETLRTVRYQQGRQEQTDRQSKTVRIGANGELTLENIAGDIVVTRGGGNDATIEVVKTARARTAEEARELLGLVTVTVVERGGRAEVKTIYPSDDRRNYRRNSSVSVNYNVSAPPNTRVTIASVSGSVRVSDIKGDLSANSVSGAVRIANAGRIGGAKSVSGDVEVVDTQSDGPIEAQSVSGSVLLRKLTARRVEVASVSGSVTIEDVQCDRVEAHSVSGNVDFAGALARGGRYELNSHSGDVRVAVAGTAGFEVDANSFSGSVHSDFPLSAQGGDERRGRRRELRGVFGDGSAVLDITSFSGSVVITKR
jgi:opacity protein-like surface antigen